MNIEFFRWHQVYLSYHINPHIKRKSVRHYLTVNIFDLTNLL